MELIGSLSGDNRFREPFATLVDVHEDFVPDNPVMRRLVNGEIKTKGGIFDAFNTFWLGSGFPQYEHEGIQYFAVNLLFIDGFRYANSFMAVGKETIHLMLLESLKQRSKAEFIDQYNRRKSDYEHNVRRVRDGEYTIGEWRALVGYEPAAAVSENKMPESFKSDTLVRLRPRTIV